MIFKLIFFMPLLNFQFQQIKLYNDVVFHGKLLKFLIKLNGIGHIQNKDAEEHSNKK